MTRDEALTVLRDHRDEFRRRGVLHAGLFGSTARGEARTDSDVDVLVELDPAARIGVYGFVGLRRFVAELFVEPVDVVTPGSLAPGPRRSMERDVVYAF